MSVGVQRLQNPVRTPARMRRARRTVYGGEFRKLYGGIRPERLCLFLGECYQRMVKNDMQCKCNEGSMLKTYAHCALRSLSRSWPTAYPQCFVSSAVGGGGPIDTIYPRTPTFSLGRDASQSHTRSATLRIVERTSSPSGEDWVMTGRPASPPSLTEVTRGTLPAKC
jgi:hypothetical protein